jgi:hypothetical protein
MLDWGAKPFPFTVRVKPVPPAVALVGESEEILGEGLFTIPPQEARATMVATSTATSSSEFSFKVVSPICTGDANSQVRKRRDAQTASLRLLEDASGEQSGCIRGTEGRGLEQRSVRGEISGKAKRRA